MREALLAVGEVHAAGVIHADLKPDNFLVADGASSVKIIDFGVSVRAGNACRGGTDGFEDPSLAEKGTVPTVSTDIYSFGVMSLVLLFEVEIDNCRYPMPLEPAQCSAPRPEGSGALWQLFCRCLNPDTTLRPSVDELCDGLE